MHVSLDKRKSHLLSLKTTAMNNTGGLGASVWGVQFQSLDSPGSVDYPLWKVRSPVRGVPFLTQRRFFMEEEYSHHLNYAVYKIHNEHMYVLPVMMEE